MRTVVRNGVVYEPLAGQHLGERTVVIEDGTIVEVVEGKWSGEVDVDLDARGRHVLPGFVDGHVHLSIHTMDFRRASREWDFERALAVAALSEATVRRGFTTVRDTGGDLRGLKQSIRRNLCGGPRIVSAGHMLSQTGGHGDLRGSVVDPPECGCQIITSPYAHVADGPSAVRKAARQSLRDGSDFIKIHTSGGVASPSDPLDSVQYTAEEVSTIVTEAEHRHTYVTAHAYSPESMRLAADNGVACLEHGNLVDAATASHLAGLGTTVVPTLVTYWAFRDHAEKFGFPERNQAKNDGLFEQGRAAIGLFRDAGVDLGFGTDLLGEAQPYQNQEFAIRAELEPAVDVLRSMYVTNVRLCDLVGKIGTVSPGAHGDLVVTDVDPLEDLAALADPEAALAAVVQGGRPIVDRLDG
jgi:imidazolonepropionase-like amidohydrolase